MQIDELVALAPAIKFDLWLYSAGSIRRFLGDVAADSLEREIVAPARTITSRWLAGPPNLQRDLAALIALFVLGQSVHTRLLDDVFTPQMINRLIQAGILAPASEHGGEQTECGHLPSALRSTIELRPIKIGDGEILLASDWKTSITGQPLRPNHVMGAGSASLTLARLMPPITTEPTNGAPKNTAPTLLDLGTGGAILAIIAASNGWKVTATDLSERALTFAKFNAALAEVEIEFLRGDLLAPVEGRLFDAVIANPPFVITPPSADPNPQETDLVPVDTVSLDPEAGVSAGGVGAPGGGGVNVGEPGVSAGEPGVLRYRDGGRRGDALLGELLTGLPAIMAPGATAQLLANWEIPHERPPFANEPVHWSQRLEKWVEAGVSGGCGVDAWAVQRECLDPGQYAQMWLRESGIQPTDPGYGPAHERWLKDFESRDTEKIGMGYVTLRRHQPGAPGWDLRRYETHTGPADKIDGHYIAEILRNVERLAEITQTPPGQNTHHTGGGLFDSRLLVALDVTQENHLIPGASNPSAILLRQGGGFGRAVQVGTALAAFTGACDGELNCGQINDALAHLLDVEKNSLWKELKYQIEDLIRDGFLKFMDL